MKVFALTGGIGSGKSTVARLFTEWSIPVVDADQIARLVVEPGTPALAQLVEMFGAHLLLPDGSLDRAVLGTLVFSDPRNREQLNAIVHPAVRREVSLAFERIRDEGHPLACYDIPLLFETAQQDSYRPVVVVAAPDELRIERILARDGLERAAAIARISSQLPLAEKVAQADIVIDNGGSLPALKMSAQRALADVRTLIGS